MSAFIKTATLLLTLCLCPHGTATGQAQAPYDLNGHALLVTYRDQVLFFLPMRGARLQSGGGFTPSPMLVVNPPAADDQRVSYIEVTAAFQGGMWRVKVSVTFGRFYDAGKKELAAYQLREGEPAQVTEINQYGLEPFDVSVVRVERAPAVRPTVVNRTSSIVVSNVAVADLPAPYRISFKNVSGKAVQTFELVASSGKGRRTLTWPEGRREHPLIEAGGEYEVEMPSEQQVKDPATSRFVSEQLHVIEVNTVVFTDGTYEGNPDLAGLQNAMMFGTSTQLDRILSLMREAQGIADAESALAQLKADVSSLSEIVDPTAFAVLKSRFPSLSVGRKEDLRGSAQRKMHDVKAGLKREILEFERARGRAESESFKSWLEKEKAAYEKWRASLP
jgi:hypothetical protein